MSLGVPMMSLNRTRGPYRMDYRGWCRSFVSEALDWNFILERACNIRSDNSAKFIDEARHVGAFHLDRKLKFGDGRIWVARVRTPGPKWLAGGEKMLEVEACLKSEIASAKFLREKSSIPMQEVYGFDLGVTDEVGAPFVLFEYVGDTTANELRISRCGSESNMYGTNEQDTRFRQQLAEIQVGLAEIVCDGIGSLTCDERNLRSRESTDAVFIGPELRTGKGPWTSSAEYFKDLAKHELSACKDSGMRHVMDSPSHLLPREFVRLMELYSSECPPASQDHHLMDRKLGADNLLVDEDFNIVGFLEWDGIMAAPIQQVVQFPRKTGLSIPAHGENCVDMADFEQQARAERRRARYHKMLKRAERGRAVKISRDMHMVGATIMKGLVRYGDHAWYKLAWDKTAPPRLSPWYDPPDALCRSLRDQECVRVNESWYAEYRRLVRESVVARRDSRADDDESSESSESFESSEISVSYRGSESSREIVD